MHQDGDGSSDDGEGRVAYLDSASEDDGYVSPDFDGLLSGSDEGSDDGSDGSDGSLSGSDDGSDDDSDDDSGSGSDEDEHVVEAPTSKRKRDDGRADSGKRVKTAAQSRVETEAARLEQEEDLAMKLLSRR